MIKIEKGIPIPSASLKNQYPFHDMSIGDSFFIPFSEKEEKRVRANLYVEISKYLRATKGEARSFITRSVKGGCRVWKVK